MHERATEYKPKKETPMKIANKFAENVIIDAETLAAKYSEEMRAW